MRDIWPVACTRMLHMKRSSLHGSIAVASFAVSAIAACTAEAPLGATPGGAATGVGVARSDVLRGVISISTVEERIRALSSITSAQAGPTTARAWGVNRASTKHPQQPRTRRPGPARTALSPRSTISHRDRRSRPVSPLPNPNRALDGDALRLPRRDQQRADPAAGLLTHGQPHRERGASARSRRARARAPTG